MKTIIFALFLSGCASNLRPQGAGEATSFDARIAEIRTAQAERQKEIEQLEEHVRQMQRTCAEVR